MKTITLTVSPDGQIKIETSGFTGRSCLEQTEFLKEALGQELFNELTPVALMTDKLRHVLICAQGGHSF